MILYAMAVSSLLYSTPADLISFQKISPDSVDAIEPSRDGYTSRSTNAIIVYMKNGDSVSVLRDKDGLLRPLSLETTANKAWFTTANPRWVYKKGNCATLLCSLPHGACKCSDVVADSGYFFESFSDSAQTGCTLAEVLNSDVKSTKGGRKKRKLIKLSEVEMTKRFIGDFNKLPRIFRSEK